MKKFFSLWTCLFLFSSLSLFSQKLFSQEVSLQSFEDVMDKVSSMTIEEKAYQVMMVGIPFKENPTAYIKKEFQQGIPASVLLFKKNLQSTPLKTKEYIDELHESFASISNEKKLTHIAPLIAIDNEGGQVFRTANLTTALPSAEKIASSIQEPEKAEELYFLVAQQMKMLGINFNLAPVVECSTPENKLFLNTRTFSSDVDITVSYANAFIKGMSRAGVLTSLKHLPGHGAGDTHKDSFTLSCTKEEFEEFYLAPFKKILEAKHPAISILLSHTSFPIVEDIPFSISKKGITSIVRKKLGFASLLLSDDIAMAALTKRGSVSDNAIRALQAGIDMIVLSGQRVQEVAKAITKKAKNDESFRLRLDEATCRVLQLKHTLQNMDEKNKLKFDNELFYELKQKGDAIIRSFCE